MTGPIPTTTTIIIASGSVLVSFTVDGVVSGRYHNHYASNHKMSRAVTMRRTTRNHEMN